MSIVRAYAATAAKQPLKPFSFDPGPLAAESIEIDVEYCGICHSDLSMLNNDWGMTNYPLVPGHEVVGKVSAIGSDVTTVKVGQRVGLGWFSQSCLKCRTCMSGDHNLCGTAEQTIVGRHGGFAEKVRGHESWVLPLPEGLDPAKAGPLFCGGITAFNPLVQFDVKPTDCVGVVGIGGLGHMALQFLNKWGCEVVAFTSESKKSEALKLGAHHAVSSRDSNAIADWKGKLNFLLVTANVKLDWDAYINTLAPRGRLHFVGAVLEPVPVGVFSLLGQQREVSASPLGSPLNTMKLLEFCARHKIGPVVEEFPMSQVNEALHHLESGEARYRIVLRNDF